ncbi:hypothetical protein [Zavarzinia compransoris]|uniref:Uncharacterized protein n=1 Tax=Zavarzinia compransoris TaxID=1264899 RepID=A0A317EFM3_9PROT|nr:hypothetical protein [Zavarzinia compransoris]PWR23985.1 hypothetical protein DKG75_05435 [Zavarzinia compransoris]TDP48243.1 hypothetical protein DES42_102546 [Zavarzinia compransoris]
MIRLLRLVASLLRLGTRPAATAAPVRPPSLPLPAIAFAYPWIALTDGAARALFDRELRLELVPGHPLHGIGATAIGRVDGEDDILFALDDGRLAVVHLTFIGKPEQSPAWPRCTLFATAAAFEAAQR